MRVVHQGHLGGVPMELDPQGSHTPLHQSWPRTGEGTMSNATCSEEDSEGRVRGTVGGTVRGQ